MVPPNPLRKIAELLDMSVEQVAPTRIGTIILHRNVRFANRFAVLVKRIIQNTGSVEYTRIWLNAAHADLNHRSPLDVIDAGGIEVIEAMMQAYETGQPG